MADEKPYPTVPCGGVIRSGLIANAADLGAAAVTDWTETCKRARSAAVYALLHTETHPLGRLELDGPIESFAFIDAKSGELMMAWRVECRALKQSSD